MHNPVSIVRPANPFIPAASAECRLMQHGHHRQPIANLHAGEHSGFDVL
jgi:hypothetical protein